MRSVFNILFIVVLSSCSSGLGVDGLALPPGSKVDEVTRDISKAGEPMMQDYIDQAQLGEAKRVKRTLFSKPGGWQPIMAYFDQEIKALGFQIISSDTDFISTGDGGASEAPTYKRAYLNRTQMLLVVLIDADRFGRGDNDPSISSQFSMCVFTLGGTEKLWMKRTPF